MSELTKAQKKNAKRAAARKSKQQVTNASMSPVVVWFRADFRTGDNPALFEASQSGAPVIPVFIRDEEDTRWPVQGAGAQWTHFSLISLGQSLSECGSNLICRRGGACTHPVTGLELARSTVLS